MFIYIYIKNIISFSNSLMRCIFAQFFLHNGQMENSKSKKFDWQVREDYDWKSQIGGGWPTKLDVELFHLGKLIYLR